jgi:hypothetical protein
VLMWLWTYLAVTAETVMGVAGRVVWWLSTPIRFLVRRHHTNIARKYDELAQQMAVLGLGEQAAAMQVLATKHRRKAGEW